MGRGQAFQQWQLERLGEISPTTGQITGTPSSSGTITITAQTTGATGRTTLQWTVVAPDNVTIAPTPAHSSTVGETVNLGIAATDLYENLITWTATGLPAGISMNPRGLKHYAGSLRPAGLSGTIVGCAVPVSAALGADLAGYRLPTLAARNPAQRRFQAREPSQPAATTRQQRATIWQHHGPGLPLPGR